MNEYQLKAINKVHNVCKLQTEIYQWGSRNNSAIFSYFYYEKQKMAFLDEMKASQRQQEQILLKMLKPQLFIQFHLSSIAQQLILLMKTQTPEESSSKIKTIILQLNKSGLSHLRYLDFTKSISYFKKAERIIEQQLLIDHTELRTNQLASITYNNLACYYKKTKKPKVALTYLTKCLKIELEVLKDWLSISSTHLNICAIYSALDKHRQALSHANLALQLLSKKKFDDNEKGQQRQSYINIHTICLYNKAIELEHLKENYQSIETYKLTRQYAQKLGTKNVSIIISCQQALKRLEEIEGDFKRRMINLILKKKEDYQSGNHQYIRKNVKNMTPKHYSRFSHSNSINGIGTPTAAGARELLYSQKGECFLEIIRAQNTSVQKSKKFVFPRSKTQKSD